MSPSVPPSLQRTLRRLAFAALLSLGASTLHAQSTLHEWTFDSGSVNSLAGFGWQGWGALDSENAVNLTNVLSYDSAQPRLGRIRTIKAADGTNVLAACTGNANVAKNRFAAITAINPLSLDEHLLGSISWTQASTSLDGTVRLLVRCGDKWHASARAYGNAAVSGIAVVNNAEVFRHDLAGPEGLLSNAWHPVVVDDGLPIERASSQVGTPLGVTITGVGFLVEFAGNHDRRIYLDNIRIVSSHPGQ